MSTSLEEDKIIRRLEHYIKLRDKIERKIKEARVELRQVQTKVVFKKKG